MKLGVKGENNPNYKHGLSKSRIYRIWADMLSRCENKNNPSYKDYGGRNIQVCDHWKTFINFYKDMAETYLDYLEIDRIDNNSGYNKDNCRWATEFIQSINKRTPVNNTTGIKNISYDKDRNKYIVYYRKKFLGRYNNIEFAKTALNNYKEKING